MIALIPARQNSKRLPGKNLRKLGGKPLVQWTIESALESEVFGTNVIVCSDDQRVLEVAHSCGAVAFQRRGVSDAQPDIEWVTEVISLDHAYDLPENREDQFAILRPTSPFRDAYTIRKAYEQWQSAALQCFSSLRTIRRVSEPPQKMWYREGKSWLPLSDELSWDRQSEPWNLPTQCYEGPPFYVQTAGLEFSWSSNLESGSISGTRIYGYELEGAAALDINTLEDWWVAERYAGGA